MNLIVFDDELDHSTFATKTIRIANRQNRKSIHGVQYVAFLRFLRSRDKKYIAAFQIRQRLDQSHFNRMTLDRVLCGESLQNLLKRIFSEHADDKWRIGIGKRI